MNLLITLLFLALNLNATRTKTRVLSSSKKFD